MARSWSATSRANYRRIAEVARKQAQSETFDAIAERIESGQVPVVGTGPIDETSSKWLDMMRDEPRD